MRPMPADGQIGQAECLADGSGNPLLPDRQVRRAAHLAFDITSSDFLLDVANTPHLEQQVLCDLGAHGMNQ